MYVIIRGKVVVLIQVSGLKFGFEIRILGNGDGDEVR